MNTPSRSDKVNIVDGKIYKVPSRAKVRTDAEDPLCLQSPAVVTGVDRQQVPAAGVVHASQEATTSASKRAYPRSVAPSTITRLRKTAAARKLTVSDDNDSDVQISDVTDDDNNTSNDVTMKYKKDHPKFTKNSRQQQTTKATAQKPRRARAKASSTKPSSASFTSVSDVLGESLNWTRMTHTRVVLRRHQLTEAVITHYVELLLKGVIYDRASES